MFLEDASGKLAYFVNPESCTVRTPDSAIKMFHLVPQAAQCSGSLPESGEPPQVSRRELEEEVEKLRKINQEFYRFAVEELLTEVRTTAEKERT